MKFDGVRRSNDRDNSNSPGEDWLPVVFLADKPFQVIRIPLDGFRVGASAAARAETKMTMTKTTKTTKMTLTTTTMTVNDFKPKWVGILRGEINKLKERLVKAHFVEIL